MQANSESGLRIVPLGVIQQLRGQEEGGGAAAKSPPWVGGWSIERPCGQKFEEKIQLFKKVFT